MAAQTSLRDRALAAAEPAPQEPRGRLVLLWLPEAYYDLIAGILGGDAEQHHNLERCVAAMLEQTATSEPSEATRREEMSLRGGLHTMHFHRMPHHAGGCNRARSPETAPRVGACSSRARR